jgi:putative endonuclease
MQPTHRPHRLGIRGEALAAQRLERAGWQVLERGYRLGRREVDLIVRRGPVLAFVEVKTRSGPAFGPPEEAVTRRKRAEIEAVALDYLTRHGRDVGDVRFDVVAIEVASGGAVTRYEHIEDAWRPER